MTKREKAEIKTSMSHQDPRSAYTAHTSSRVLHFNITNLTIREDICVVIQIPPSQQNSVYSMVDAYLQPNKKLTDKKTN